MKMRARVAAAGVAGLVLGLATGLLLRGDGEPTPAPAPAAGDVAAAAPPGLGALREELARERAAREALQADVDELRDAVLEWTALPPEAPGSEQADSALARDEEAARPDDSPWFDADALLETGLAAPEVERLRERFAEHELAELFLRDGEEDYDRMLYAAGRQNRVRIVDVLPDSPAQRAGLAAGDVVVSYAGERMFEILPLTQATRGGNPGDPTEIRYVRNGEEQRVYVPRGPLGVRLGPGRLPPAP
jgi:hypothetical protein